MRGTISFLVGILTAAVVAAFGILITQNSGPAHYTFLGNSLDGASGWLLAGAGAVGFLLALLIAVPGRIAGSARRRALARQLNASAERITTLREKYAELHGDYQRLHEEHEQLLSRIVVTTPQGAQGDGVNAYASPAARPLRRTGPLYPPGQPPHLLDESTDVPPGEEPPTLLERAQSGWAALRARLHRQPASPEPSASSATANSPAAEANAPTPAASAETANPPEGQTSAPTPAA